MLNKSKALLAGLLVIGLTALLVIAGMPKVRNQNKGSNEIMLKIGSVTVAPSSLTSGGCIQVPVIINDPSANNRDLRDITVSLEISDPSNVISGGIATNMIVANGFSPTGAGTGTVGLTSPGTNLANSNGTSTPNCSAVFNQVTEGQGPAISFAGNTNTFANWSVNNNGGGVGRKVAFISDLVGNANIGMIPQNTDTLVIVLEIPIISNPGQAQITIQPYVGLDTNFYTYDTGVRDEQGNFVQVQEDFQLPASAATVNIFDPVDCAGATTTPTNPTWADPQDGGVGGVLNFNFPGTALADQIHLTSSDGLDVTIPSAGATTTYSIDTAGDGSPTTGANRTYTATYQVEFPPLSDVYVDGTPCVITPNWAPASAAMAWDPQPVFGQATTLDITLTNAVYSGAPKVGGPRYANLTGPNGVNVDLTVPTSGGGTNVLVFNNALSIGSVSNLHVGTYTVTGEGPNGLPFTQQIVLTLEPPVNQTVCGNITAANIEGSVTIPLAGNDGTVDFTVIYDGATYDDLPEGNFVLNNIVGDVTSVTIRANGFDGSGNPTFDQDICDINYNLPTCVASQDPTGTVDVGTVIDLTLATTNAVAVTINGVAMTPDVDPDDNFNVSWSAQHTAIMDTTVTAVVTNSDGETTTCSWIIDINCIDPTIVSVAPVGQSGITIYGTFGCTYTVRITQHRTGVSTDYDVVINTLTNPGLNEGTGTLNVVVPSDSWIEVGQDGFPTATDMIPTVPTLGEYGMMALVLLLMGAGVFVIRKRQV